MRKRPYQICSQPMVAVKNQLVISPDSFADGLAALGNAKGVVTYSLRSSIAVAVIMGEFLPCLSVFTERSNE